MLRNMPVPEKITPTMSSVKANPLVTYQKK